MPEQPYQPDPISALLAEFSTRLNETEEKQRIIKDRILLIGENLISTKEDLSKLESEIKIKLKHLDPEINNLKQLINRIVGEIPNFAKKSELEILERQMKMFQPLEFARIKDVQDIVKREIMKLEKQKK